MFRCIADETCNGTHIFASLLFKVPQKSSTVLTLIAHKRMHACTHIQKEKESFTFSNGRHLHSEETLNALCNVHA